MQVILRCIATNHSIECSTPITGVTLLQALNQECLTLASVKPLNNGAVYRRFRPVSRNNVSYDLTQYGELYDADRKLVALIEAV